MPYTSEPILFGSREAVTREPNRRAGEATARREQKLAKLAFDTLWGFYPGHAWKTRVDSTPDGGFILMIQIAILMDEARWFTIPDHKLGDGAQFVKRVDNAGGQLLERFGLARGMRELEPFLNVRLNKRLWGPNDRMPE